MRAATKLLTLTMLVIAGASSARAGGKPAPGPVAHVVEVTGQVSMVRGKAAPVRVALLYPLRAGDVVRTGKDGQAEVVYLASGLRFRLVAGSQAEILAAAVRARSGPAPVRLPPLSLGQSASSDNSRILGFVVRGGGNGPRDPSPNGAVRTTPVQLRWSGPIDAKEVEVSIFSGERVVWRQSFPAQTRDVAVPSGKVRPGVVYVWTASAISDTGDLVQTTSALLRILTDAENRALADIEAWCKRDHAARPESPTPHLLLASAYTRLTMITEALASYEEALKVAPDSPNIREAMKKLRGER